MNEKSQNLIIHAVKAKLPTVTIVTATFVNPV